MGATLTGDLTDDEGTIDVGAKLSGEFYEYDGSLAVAGDARAEIGDGDKFYGGFAAVEK